MKVKFKFTSFNQTDPGLLQPNGQGPKFVQLNFFHPSLTTLRVGAGVMRANSKVGRGGLGSSGAIAPFLSIRSFNR